MSEAQAQGQVVPAEAPTHPEAQPEVERSYSQADLNKIAANEKRDGRTSAINELLEKTGAESIDDVLAAYSEYSEIQEAVTSEADRANARTEKAEAKEKEWQERYYTEKRTNAARHALRDAGANPERLAALMRIGELSALEVDKDGNVSGVEEFVANAQEEAPEFFGTAERPRINAPQTTGTGVQTPTNSGMSPEEAHANALLRMFDNSR